MLILRIDLSRHPFEINLYDSAWLLQSFQRMLRHKARQNKTFRIEPIPFEISLYQQFNMIMQLWCFRIFTTATILCLSRYELKSWLLWHKGRSPRAALKVGYAPAKWIVWPEVLEAHLAKEKPCIVSEYPRVPNKVSTRVWGNRFYPIMLNCSNQTRRLLLPQQQVRCNSLETTFMLTYYLKTRLINFLKKIEFIRK